MVLNRENKIGLVIILLFILLIFINEIIANNNDKKLLNYKITTAKIIGIKHSGSHSPSRFYYVYWINDKKYEDCSRGKIPDFFENKKIKIKYAINDNSISEVYNLDSLIRSGN